MSLGEAKRTTSLTFFGNNNNNTRPVIGQASKRSRLQGESTDVPSIQVTSDNQTRSNTSKADADAIAIELNRLTEKCCRYQSHKDFLLKCKAAKQIPVGLQLTLEPSIGNQDEEFLKQWFEKLDECSIIFMNMVTDFCENTIVSLDQQKTQTKETLKQALHKEEYSEAIDIIDSNEKEVTHALQQRKSKKFNYLKYHKGRTTQQYEQSSRGRERTKDRPSYAEAANPRYRRVPISSRKSSFINLNDKRHLDPKPSYSNLSIKEKVQNPNWKVPRKTSSKTQFDERKNENYLRHQVADLTKELEKVKSGNSNNHATPIVEQELPSTDSYSKNPFMASYRGQSKKENVKLAPDDILNYIAETMDTLKSLGEQFKAQSCSRMTQRD